MDKEYCMKQVGVCDKGIRYNLSEIEKAKSRLIAASEPKTIDIIVEDIVRMARRIASWEKMRKNWLDLAHQQQANRQESK